LQIGFIVSVAVCEGVPGNDVIDRIAVCTARLAGVSVTLQYLQSNLAPFGG
jgi:hypothetical protein